MVHLLSDGRYRSLLPIFSSVPLATYLAKLDPWWQIVSIHFCGASVSTFRDGPDMARTDLETKKVKVVGSLIHILV